MSLILALVLAGFLTPRAAVALEAALEAAENLSRQAAQSGELSRDAQAVLWNRAENAALSILARQPDGESCARVWEIWCDAIRAQAFLAGAESDWRRIIARVKSQKALVDQCANDDGVGMWLLLADDLLQYAEDDICRDSRPTLERADEALRLAAAADRDNEFVTGRVLVLRRLADVTSDDDDWLLVLSRLETLLRRVPVRGVDQACQVELVRKNLVEARLHYERPKPDENEYAALAARWPSSSNIGPGRSRGETEIITKLAAKRVWNAPETDGFMELVSLLEYEIATSGNDEEQRALLARLKTVLIWGMTRCSQTQDILAYSINYAHSQWPRNILQTTADRMYRLDELETLLAMALLNSPWEQKEILDFWRAGLYESRDEAKSEAEIADIEARILRLSRIASQKIPYHQRLSDQYRPLRLKLNY